MRTTRLLILAGYATSTLAYKAEIFTCIELVPYCCTMVTTTGIGLNCQAATLENIYKVLNETMIDDEANPHDGTSPFVSVCYLSPGLKSKTAQIPACCYSQSTSITPNLNMLDCLPPAQSIGRYDSDLGIILFTDSADSLSEY